jgi:putative membrane protein
VIERPGFVDIPTSTQPGPPPASDPLPDRGWIDLPGDGPEGPIRHAAAAALLGPTIGGAQPPLVIGAIAIVLLLVTLAGLELANFIGGQFARSTLLGWLTVGLLSPLGAMLLWSTMREWRGFVELQTVEGLRERLMSEDLPTARAAAEAWLAAIGAGAETSKVVAGARDAETMRALIRSGPLARVDEAVDEAARSAALQVMAVTAVCPWPGLDGMLVAWRGLRLVRQVAALHGIRPGTLGTLRMFQRVALDATTVAGADIAASALTEALFNSPAVGGLVGQATGSAIAARRILRLAYAVARTCRPIRT